jgi:hypothetical protein
MPRVSIRVARRALLLGAFAIACHAPTEGGSFGPIRIVAGGEQTDTVMAILSQPLTVEIRDSTSRIAPGRLVWFRQIIPPGETLPAALAVAPVGGDIDSFNVLANDVTDAQGRARTQVRFLNRAGTALLEVSLYDVGMADTIAYTIEPGRPVRLEAWPRDTTIVVGDSYPVQSTLTDQFYNPVPGATPTYTATGVSVSSAGQVSATDAISHALIYVTSGQYSDSVTVSFAPRLRLVYNRAGSVVLVNTDGTGSTTLATTTNLYIGPSSVAATPSVVYYEGDPSTDGKIWVVEPNGTPRLLLNGTTRPEGWPKLSLDGEWVYFVRDGTTLWRARLDGSALDSITSFAPPQVYRAPTISPDGGSVAIEDIGGLKIVDLATRAETTLPVSCPLPRYSPDGSYFACAAPGEISVVRSDGTGQRVVTTFSDGRTADPLSGLDWTPDGRWILASVYGPTLVAVSTGSAILLTAVNGNVFEPSFVR